jgi:serine/threonine protein kinase
MDLSGVTIGQYRIIDQIGEGGMARVYRADQPSMGRTVAIKMLLAERSGDATLRARFQREIRVIASLEHPSILPVYDTGEYDEMLYIVMRYVTGGSLYDEIERTGYQGLPLDFIDQVVMRVAAGLDLAHRRGVIHRDVKPRNVLLDEDGLPYLADFGISKVAEGTMDITQQGVVGTAAYIAPELIQSPDVTPLVDVYALAVTLFQMLVGRVPFERESGIQTILSHASDPIPDVRAYRPDLPDTIQDVIDQGMAKSPADRYQSARALAEALHVAIAPSTTAEAIIERTAPAGVGQVSAVLVALDGPLVGQQILVTTLPYTIGRTSGNVLRLDDGLVSREHAYFEMREDRGMWIVDLGSSNGTFVNGQRVDGARRLAEGDTVTIGGTVLRVMLRRGESA